VACTARDLRLSLLNIQNRREESVNASIARSSISPRVSPSRITFFESDSEGRGEFAVLFPLSQDLRHGSRYEEKGDARDPNNDRDGDRTGAARRRVWRLLEPTDANLRVLPHARAMTYIRQHNQNIGFEDLTEADPEGINPGGPCPVLAVPAGRRPGQGRISRLCEFGTRQHTSQ
jgi:hypothetical protein